MASNDGVGGGIRGMPVDFRSAAATLEIYALTALCLYLCCHSEWVFARSWGHWRVNARMTTRHPTRTIRYMLDDLTSSSGF